MLGAGLIRLEFNRPTHVSSLCSLSSLLIYSPQLTLILIHLTGADNPTYLKESGDKVNVTVAFLGVSLGLSVILKGLWDMSWGQNKVAK